MSNKRCPQCGKSYPSTYRSCPYCSGGSRRRRPAPESPLDRTADILREYGERIFLGVTAFFLVIALLGMVLTKCSADSDPKPAQDENTQQPENEDPQPVSDPLVISNTTLALFVGESAVLTVEGGAETEDTLVWTTSDEVVADIAEGMVTAKTAGTATITASRGAEQTFCVVTVKEKDPEVEVYLNRKDFTLSAKYPYFQMEVKVRETKRQYDGNVVWSIGDTSVATVSETGLVERVGKGTTTVTATMGTKTLDCIVRVS